jgi:hypothetical protein
MDNPEPVPDVSGSPTAPSPPAPQASSPAADTPGAAPPPAAPTPPPRSGLFRPRAPLTPEQSQRVFAGRLKTFGFAFIVLGAFALAQMGMYVLSGYEQAVVAGGPAVQGGDLEVHFLPADAKWNVTAQQYDGNHTTFAGPLASGQDGTVHLKGVEHAVFTLVARHENQTLQGAVFAPPGGSTTVTVDGSRGSQDWFGGKPQFPAPGWIVYGIIGTLVAVGMAGGVALVRRTNRRLAMIGAGCLAAVGMLTALRLDIFGLAMVVLGVWAILTIRKNPALFAPKAST